jgi:osmoprotectant transport system permease protein
VIGDIVGWFTDPANWQGQQGALDRLLQHLGYVLGALLVAAVVALPVGLFVGHTGRGGVVLVGAANIIRALPTLGLVTFLFLLFTDSLVAAVIGLVVLAIPPILAGTYAGLQAVDDHVVDAAEGMGMRGRQQLWQVELPIALPLIIGGVRNAVLQLVATAAVAAYVGLGGLGRFLLDGLAVFDYAEVVAGAVLTAVLAIVLDLALAGLQRAVVPRGVRLSAQASAAATRSIVQEVV